jgi:hypothetical protein
MLSFFTGLRILGEVSLWSEKALSDGVITLTEAVDLATKVGLILGVRLELDVSSLVTEPINGELETPELTPSRTLKSWES